MKVMQSRHESLIREFPGFRVVHAYVRVRLPPNNQTGYLRYV
jgi:hypothetical protein